ncbi:alkaline phosphatase family protein [Telmatobacter bradus]|uniref:alkaline phosphatase family protein n=1 Tax=Telmatobacter bradus TaxID=474953 RepID=UPI003B4282FD
MKLFVACVAALLVLSHVVAHAQAFAAKPKLIVIVVIDQFRGDYLMRDRAKFQGRGFRLFTEQGAWFTDCYYDYANTKTAPGHATIGTGAYTDGHGIDSNEWWDPTRSFDEQVSSVQDERYRLVDVDPSSIPANQPGAPANAAKFLVGSSPLNLRATTLGDELRLATAGKARVYGVSLKDRAAILPAGQTANGAFWVEQNSGKFTTSTFYMQHLPGWATAFNEGGRRAQAAREANADENTQQFFELVGRTPAANDYELDFAKALIDGEHLGQNDVTDLLVVSLSPNDIQGHQFGPDSESEEQMILGLDKSLDNFNNWLDKKIGLNNVWMALTADHGVAPVPGEAAKLGVNAVAVKMDKVYDALNVALAKRFAPAQPTGAAKPSFLMPHPDLPYIVLDKRTFAKLHIDEKTAEDAVAELLPEAVATLNQNPPPVLKPNAALPAPSEERLPTYPRVQYAYTRLQLANGQLPPSDWGREIAHSYTSHGNWFVMMVLDAYQMQGSGQFAGTTHFSPWSYDRHVPLGFYGEPFVAGEYHGRVAPVDLAVTFASLAGVNLPSAASGRVLSEAVKTVKAAK